MNRIRHLSNRLFLLWTVILLACAALAACRPTPAAPTPNIHELVATGRAGTQYAWTLDTMVAATQGALAGPAQTPTPPGGEAASAPEPAAASENPCAGSQPGKRAYVDENHGFCLFYPEDFFVNKPLNGGVEFLGPALDQSSQPLRAYINITRQESVNGRTLDELARDVWKESQGAYRLSNIRLGGQDALVAEDLQIGEAGWKVKQVLFTHNGSIYLISLSPVDPTPPFSSVLPDIQRFWDMAIPSFTYR